MGKSVPEFTMRTSPNPDSLEMNRFRDGLRQVLSVSKADLNRLLADDKAAKAGKLKPGPKPKSSASVPASSGSD
jgi:hypothetical protein